MRRGGERQQDELLVGPCPERGRADGEPARRGGAVARRAPVGKQTGGLEVEVGAAREQEVGHRHVAAVGAAHVDLGEGGVDDAGADGRRARAAQAEHHKAQREHDQHAQHDVRRARGQQHGIALELGERLPPQREGPLRGVARGEGRLVVVAQALEIVRDERRLADPEVQQQGMGEEQPAALVGRPVGRRRRGQRVDQAVGRALGLHVLILERRDEVGRAEIGLHEEERGDDRQGARERRRKRLGGVPRAADAEHDPRVGDERERQDEGEPARRPGKRRQQQPGRERGGERREDDAEQHLERVAAAMIRPRQPWDEEHDRAHDERLERIGQRAHERERDQERGVGESDPPKPARRRPSGRRRMRVPGAHGRLRRVADHGLLPRLQGRTARRASV